MEQPKFRPTASPVKTVAVNTQHIKLPEPVAPVKPIAPYEPARPRAPQPSNVDQLAQALAGLNPKINIALNKFFEDRNKDEALDAEIAAMRDQTLSWSEAVAKDPSLADRSPVFRQVYESRTARTRVQKRAGELLAEYWSSDIAGSDDPTAINGWLAERMKEVYDSAKSPAEKAALIEEIQKVSQQFIAGHRERSRGNLLTKNRESISTAVSTAVDNSFAQGPAAPFQTQDPVALETLKEKNGTRGLVQAAFLNAISGGESAGKYNIRFNGGAGAIFELNGQHPQVKVPVQLEDGTMSTSDAAGRYQFLSSTWRRVMGGAAFTAENQDLGALRLAELDYKARTGGDLWGDLENEGFTPRIQRALEPTWKALGKNQARHLATFNASLQRYGGKPQGPGAADARIPVLVEEFKGVEREARAQGMSFTETNAYVLDGIVQSAIAKSDETILDTLPHLRPNGVPMSERKTIEDARIKIRQLKQQEQNHAWTLAQRKREVSKLEKMQEVGSILVEQMKTGKPPRIPVAIIEAANAKDPEIAKGLIDMQKNFDDHNKVEDTSAVAAIEAEVMSGKATTADVLYHVERKTLKQPATIHRLLEQAGRNERDSLLNNDEIKPYVNGIRRIVGEEDSPGILKKPVEGTAALAAFNRSMLAFKQSKPDASPMETERYAKEQYESIVKKYKPELDFEKAQPEAQEQRRADDERKRREAAGLVQPREGVEWRKARLYDSPKTIEEEFKRGKAGDNVGNNLTSWAIKLKLSPSEFVEFIEIQKKLAAKPLNNR